MAAKGYQQAKEIVKIIQGMQVDEDQLVVDFIEIPDERVEGVKMTRIECKGKGFIVTDDVAMRINWLLNPS